MSAPQTRAPGRAPSSATAIAVRELEYIAAGHRILHDLDLDIGAGEIVAVMGMSGSGKTTLLKCLAGLLKPSHGSIIVLGQDIVPLSEDELDRVRLRLGLVFQYAALFDSLSVYENVAFGLTHARRLPRREVGPIVRERLAEVGMAGTERLLPAQLSGGMQKRVGLARALAMEPEVLLYDEPTSGLDPVIARAIDELIVETRDRRGVTSVVVSHDVPSVLRTADRIAMIHEGTLIGVGTGAEMRASGDPRIREFLAGEPGATGT
jgi:phospholipid/cholesterol/gamma-HCH transport system ATP-binding protein